MFDLDRSIEKWTRHVHPDHRDVLGRRAELEDHMYTVVEALVQDGMTEKEAFDALVSRMGKPGDLVTENKKNDAWYLKINDFFENIGYKWRQVSFVAFTFIYIFMTGGVLDVFLIKWLQLPLYFVVYFYIHSFDKEKNSLIRLVSKLYRS